MSSRAPRDLGRGRPRPCQQTTPFSSPLCGLHKAIVIPTSSTRAALYSSVVPAQSLPRTRYGGRPLHNRHCVGSGTQPPHVVIPAKAGIQSQRHGSQSTLKQWAGPVFIPLCGLHKAMVIPTSSTRAALYNSAFPRRACPVLDTGREPIPGEREQLLRSLSKSLP